MTDVAVAIAVGTTMAIPLAVVFGPGPQQLVINVLSFSGLGVIAAGLSISWAFIALSVLVLLRYRSEPISLPCFVAWHSPCSDNAIGANSPLCTCPGHASNACPVMSDRDQNSP